MKPSRIVLLLLLVLGLAVQACMPAASAPSDSQDVLATMVAATLAAVNSGAGGGVTPLPASLYYLGRDASGLYQVYQLARDGMTIRQMTFEPASVSDYDVMPTDGRLVYISNNQLLVMQADGSGRRMLADGGPINDNTPYGDRLLQPRWGPDGRTIAFHKGGLAFYDLSIGSTFVARPDIIENLGGMDIPRELYFPDQYSPDGNRLRVNIGYYEGGAYGVYDLRSGSFVTLTLSEGYGGNCCRAIWTPDSSSILVASPYLGMISPGLWRFDAATGIGSTLLASEEANGTTNFADAPIQAPDGWLYFFFANVPGYPEGTTVPLMLVRSAADGVTGRSLVYPDSLTFNDTLWARDASLVVVASQRPGSTDYRENSLSVIYLDGRSSLSLTPPAAYNLRWGP